MFKRVFLLFLSSRALFLIFAIFATQFIPVREGYLGNEHYFGEPYLAWIWANFDGRHFADIVVSGYRHFNFAYFPLYPLLVKILDYHLVIDPPYVGIALSAICFLAAMLVFYKIVSLDFREDIVYISLFLMSFFPLAFFYHTMYSDSLFLLLSALSFYFARRAGQNGLSETAKKRRWIIAGIFGGLTTATRLAGLALLPALLIEWYLQSHDKLPILQIRKSRVIVKAKNLRKSIVPFFTTAFIPLTLTGLGFISYLVYLQMFHGDFLLFQKSMTAWLQHEFIFPPQVVFRYLKILVLVPRYEFVYWIAVAEFISMILYFALTFYVAKKVRLSYAVLMFFIFLLPTFTGTFAGMPRYILHTFPAFIGIALLVSKYKFLKFPLLVIYLILGFIFTGLFTRGYFVA